MSQQLSALEGFPVAALEFQCERDSIRLVVGVIRHVRETCVQLGLGHNFLFHKLTHPPAAAFPPPTAAARTAKSRHWRSRAPLAAYQSAPPLRMLSCQRGLLLAVRR